MVRDGSTRGRSAETSKGGTRLHSSSIRTRRDEIAARAQLERSWRRSVRDVAVAFASAGVIGLLVAYVFAGPTAKLSASVGPAVPRPGTTAFVVGRIVEVDGGGLEGALVEVRRGRKLAGVTISDDAGAFRVELRGGCSAYAISLKAEASGSTVGAHTRRRLCPGDALPIDARVVTQGHFLWVPGPR